MSLTSLFYKETTPSHFPPKTAIPTFDGELIGIQRFLTTTQNCVDSFVDGDKFYYMRREHKKTYILPVCFLVVISWVYIVFPSTILVVQIPLHRERVAVASVYLCTHSIESLFYIIFRSRLEKSRQRRPRTLVCIPALIDNSQGIKLVKDKVDFGLLQNIIGYYLTLVFFEK